MSRSEPARFSGDRIRVTLDLRRSDDPALFDALAALAKGRRRIARLRMLAHDGLVASSVFSSARTVEKIEEASMSDENLQDPEQEDLETLATEVTSAIFAPPISE
ncbi:MAG: hypothetical protein I8H71_11135 [Xanthomonadaceae bacterium]|nr:hypothetical protein [Xanthomonadaceae bacterium]